ncbi:TRAP transporter substrate-binding protein [Clostridium aminobutyricum]|uniref:TRAP transporter substrate-binding protein n=1 Tax=Clostridium aminobutyricum TaxID=33953 RepID=A0A939IJG7_CLOAM|nr:TRAP transporter substrate-binding protein [Clostridium aminobutyricum]MBN7773564.1 TRAP transporter substrate-binding protein [Clostridium aminobutyricum]
MKKILIALVCLTLTIGTFAGCGSTNDSKGADSSDKKYVIQLAHVEAEGRSVYAVAEEFKAAVEEKSGGVITVNILPNGQYGGDAQAIEGTALGTIQMTMASTAPLASYNSNFMALDIPFLFDSREDCFSNVDGEFGQALNDLLPQYGLINLGYADNGLRNISNNVRPINEPADLKGIKIRVMESPIYITMFKLLGANPVPMSFGEVYTALQQGTVDAQENGAGLVYASKFQEVQKYYSLTGHVYSLDAVLVNAKFFNDLPEDLQQIVANEAKTILIDKQRKIESENDADFIQKLQDAGMIVNEISPENMAKFKSAVAPMVQDYTGSAGQKDKVEAKYFDMIK